MTQIATTDTNAFNFVGFDETGLAIYRETPTATGYDIPAPPAEIPAAAAAPRAIKIYRAVIIALLTVIAALAAITGILATHHAAPAAKPATIVRTTDDVSSYNDGWADSKFDDCQQGDATACAWLRSN